MDSTTAAVTFGASLLIAGLMQVLKQLIERVVPPADPLHDSLIQLTAAFVGAAAFVIHAATLSPLVATSFWEAAGQGATAGMVAIGAYHVLGAAPSAGTANVATLGAIAAPVTITARPVATAPAAPAAGYSAATLEPGLLPPAV